MKKVTILMTILCLSLAQADVPAVKGLISRLCPQHLDRFKLELIDAKTDTGTFEIESVDNKIVLRGDNANSVAVALNHYLKYYCHTNVSWYVDNPTILPSVLPEVPVKVVKNARCENRFFLNYCTFGYTMPWWQWKDWEHFIDWMALNGVTMPLAITGQEAVWYRVWKKFGLTDKQIRAYFTGPAHLPWHRMANIDYWQGDLPHSWLDHQLELQKKIVAREREFNMTPVLPAFAGHVPAALKESYPDSKINLLGHWGGFDGKYRSSFLDPMDPLFMEIQKEFLTEQTKLFGTDSIYGTDPFNEVKPPSWEPDYLAKVGKTIYESMTQVDPNATWLQMTWVFFFDRHNWTNERIKAMVTSVPQDKMILLDYYCENQEVWKITEKFFNQPYIWCYLGNFGGNTMLAGNLKTVEERIENTFKNGGDKVWGIGSTLEALDCNPIMYEYLFEKAWTDGPTDVNEWIKNYSFSRCGAKDDSFAKAWDILSEKIYTRSAMLGQGTLTNARPALSGQGNWTTGNYFNYDNRDLLKAWELLLNSKTKNRDSYQHDVVNVARQALGNHFRTMRDQFTTAYYLNDYSKAEKISLGMIELLDDLEELLGTRSDFMLGKWLEDAKSFAADEKEVNYYETNARTLLTTWGVRGQSLNDYGNRTWAGLTKGFYRKRWEMFIYDVLGSMNAKILFNEKLFEEKVTTFEWLWTKQSEVYSATSKGDGIELSQKLFKKYQSSVLNPPVASGLKVGGWNKSSIKTNFTEKTINISKLIKAPTTMALIFKYQRGGNAAKIKNVRLLENGKVIASDNHIGSTGYQHDKNLFRVQLKEFKKDVTYTVKYEICADGGIDSEGQIKIFQNN